ncbi:hypothetical protein [Mycolicibacterium gilvum]|uniref:hypothetical protein n=1 Tax=Mycolicibacterium gilvum TaxID=1804 RepID=UPI001F179AFA|nr:hypothetical protein [Mycolicibacterium gilvum]
MSRSLAGLVGGLDGALDELGGFLFPGPQVGTHTGAAGGDAFEDLAVAQPYRAGRAIGVDDRPGPHLVFHGLGDRGNPEIEVVRQDADRVVLGERHLR